MIRTQCNNAHCIGTVQISCAHSAVERKQNKVKSTADWARNRWTAVKDVQWYVYWAILRMFSCIFRIYLHLKKIVMLSSTLIQNCIA